MTCRGQRLLWSRLICESVRSHRDKLRYENLFRQKSASSQQLDTAAANADALAATVALDKAPRMSRNSIQLGGDLRTSAALHRTIATWLKYVCTVLHLEISSAALRG